MCTENLAKFDKKQWRLTDVVTGDESWFYHRQIGKKQTNKSWVAAGESLEQWFVRIVLSLKRCSAFSSVLQAWHIFHICKATGPSTTKHTPMIALNPLFIL
jgi:hypothetical protein